MNTNNNKNSYKIFVDLDGVLVDFDKGFEEISGGIPRDQYIRNYTLAGFWKLINGHGEQWWENLQWLSDGRKLWNSVISFDPLPTILTSGSVRNAKQVPANGKHRWVDRHLGKHIPRIIAESSTSKQHHAKPNHILIDDLYSNTLEWRTKGGISIRHKNADESINELELIFSKK